MQQETMRGSLFPLLPLRAKRQNHERVPISPISPISPILVVHVLSSCQDMGHQNRWNSDPLSVFPGWSAKTMRGSLFPLLPLRVNCHYFPYCPFKGELPKPWQVLLPLRMKRQNHERVPISPISPILVVHVLSSCQDMGHQNRWNRDPLSVFPGWSAKTMRGPLFPLFWWPMSWQDDKTWATKIREIGEIGTLSWFWHFTLRGNRGNRGPLMVLEESRYVLTFFGDWLVHASDVMVAMDETMYD